MLAKKRIQLRTKKLSDAREDYEWQCDPELCRLDAAEVLDMSYQDYVEEFTFEMCYPTSSRFEFAVETLDGKHIGNCVYYNINRAESKAEIGIMIGNRDYWNEGYGAETVHQLLNYIFNRTTLEKVYLNTLNWNLRAQRCFKKCGFADCGNTTRDGHQFILMIINRDEWENLHRSDIRRNITKKPPVN